MKGKETVLYSFTSGADGGDPNAGLVADEQGNLYGTTLFYGDGSGVVFKLTSSEDCHESSGELAEGAVAPAAKLPPLLPPVIPAEDRAVMIRKLLRVNGPGEICLWHLLWELNLRITEAVLSQRSNSQQNSLNSSAEHELGRVLPD